MENIQPIQETTWRPPTKEEMEEGEYEKYLEVLDLTENEIKEKDILDVGAGAAIFAKYAKEQGISDSIFSLDPFDVPDETEKSVHAKVENLPYKDQSFDMIISSGAFPYVLDGEDLKETENNVRNGLLEMLRVVKSGGEVRFGPISELKVIPEFDKVNKILKDILTQVVELGDVIVNKKPISPEIFNFGKKGAKSTAYTLIVKKVNLN